MALTKCKECGDTVSTKAAACPHCGAGVGKNRADIRTRRFLIFLAIGIGALFLASLVSNQKKTEQSTRLPAANQTPAQADDLSRQHVKKVTAFILNVNGLLCAQVVDIRPLEVEENVYEVECVEYRGGNGRKTYILDADARTAWER